ADSEARRPAAARDRGVHRRLRLHLAVERIAVVADSGDELQPFVIVALPLHEAAIALLLAAAEMGSVGIAGQAVVVEAIGDGVGEVAAVEARRVTNVEAGGGDAVEAAVADRGPRPDLELIGLGAVVVDG